MSSAIILSIRPEYAHRILDGTKTIELRRSAMGLVPDDVVLVYVSAPDQRFAFWFRVARVEALPVDDMWQRYHERLGIEREQYLAYFAGSRTATGLHVGEVRPLLPEIPLDEVRALMPDFVPPQGQIRLRDSVGRYAAFLSRLSTPLPPDVFPQQALFGGLASP
ncbi:MAG: ASCH domain-containing protein [Polyangiaceae bacterium]